MAAASLDARAFTVGSHIAFSAGAYGPHTAEGKQLLAHELVHVAQSDGRSRTNDVATRDSPAEREADRVSAQVVSAGIGPVSITQRATGIHLAPSSPPLMRRPSKAEQLSKVSALTRMTVEELDRQGSGKVLIACFVSNRGKPQLVRWALELQSIPHGGSDYLWEYFVQLRDYSSDIAKKFAELLENEGIAISSSASGFPDLSHLDPKAPLPPLTADVAATPMGKYVDAFSSVTYGLDYRQAEPGLLSTVLHLTYPDGAVLDLDFNLISDNRDPAPFQALGYMKIGPAGRMFPARLDADTTPRLWKAKQGALDQMRASNEDFLTFVVIAQAGVMSNLPIGPVAGPELEPEPPITVRENKPPATTPTDESATTATPTTTAHAPTQESAGTPQPTPVVENATFEKTPVDFTPSTGRNYKVYQRKDINWNQVRTAGDKRFIGKTNAQAAAQEGLPPQLPDGNFATLHHSQQDARGPFYEMSTKVHNIRNAKQPPLHPYRGQQHPDFPLGRGKGSLRDAFQSTESPEYWKWRAMNRGAQ